MRSQRGARCHAPSIRNAASLLLPMGAPLLALSLWTGCEGDAQHATREWRPEDHQAPPAIAEDGRAQPREGLGEADEARIATALWTARCARCHGAGGRGDGSDAPPGAPLPDFGDPAFHAKRSNEELALVVVKGRNLMPAFENELGAREIALLVAHVRAFGQPTTDAPSGADEQDTEAARSPASATPEKAGDAP